MLSTFAKNLDKIWGGDNTKIKGGDYIIIQGGNYFPIFQGKKAITINYFHDLRERGRK